MLRTSSSIVEPSSGCQRRTEQNISNVSIGANLIGCAVGEERSLVHHHDTVGIAEDDVHVVFNHHGGDNSSPDHRRHSIHDLRLFMSAHAAGRLVEEQQPGTQSIGDGNVEELALTLRQTSGRSRGFARQPELTQHIERLATYIAVVVGQSCHLHRLAVAGEYRERHIVEGRKAVEQVDDLETAGNACCYPLRDCGKRDIATFEQDLAAIRLKVRADQIYKRRLAGSVRAHKRQEFALVYDEIEAVAGARLAELLPQVDCPQQYHATVFRLPSRCPARDIAPTMPVGNTSTNVTSTTPSRSCQYSVVATA